MAYVKPDRIVMKTDPQFNERWVQERIAEDPSILGLGDLVLKDKERIQPQAGRLDLLCQEADGSRRYEIEIQLGRTDESHIIRTLEYWDNERKRYPQYDHVAIIVAEEITGRFLNVISLFNGFIPLMAVQMQALRVAEHVSLVFTTVLDEVRLGLEEEDEPAEAVDRGYWESRATKTTMELTDSLLAVITAIDPGFTLKYNKYYVGLARGGQPLNFALFRPKKDWVRVELKLNRSDETQTLLEQAGIDLMEYDSRNGRYKFRLFKGDVHKHEALLDQLFRSSLVGFEG
jgi:hypothetical protein